ncbi:MAG: hypothetical protein IJS14_14770 [Lentisphaeria bacterium]|nr:hypothetical protein [Lentisphaeria bacterium]
MDQKQIKDFIAQKVPEGFSLSKIQDLLKEQGVHITFMELRLLASEIEESVWKKTEKEEAPAPAEPANTPADPQAAEADDFADGPADAAPAEPASPAPEDPAKPAAPRGKTTVELSKIARPGAAASGTVKFGSGVTAEWVIDQLGRLGLENASGQPDQQDIREFQIELQKLFS